MSVIGEEMGSREGFLFKIEIIKYFMCKYDPADKEILMIAVSKCVSPKHTC